MHMCRNLLEFWGGTFVAGKSLHNDESEPLATPGSTGECDINDHSPPLPGHETAHEDSTKHTHTHMEEATRHTWRSGRADRVPDQRTPPSPE